MGQVSDLPRLETQVLVPTLGALQEHETQNDVAEQGVKCLGRWIPRIKAELRSAYQPMIAKDAHVANHCSDKAKGLDRSMKTAGGIASPTP
mmetsp:Transcript_27418/g.33453  ORF Transcript_27418/g.33453 Transcript_27418/m.33453 type:complete len:91 (-) Transcript_27418:69-341(-)